MKIHGYKVVLGEKYYENEQVWESNKTVKIWHRSYHVPKLGYSGNIIVNDYRSQEEYQNEIWNDIENCLLRTKGEYIE